MIKVILVHGWGGGGCSEESWFGLLKNDFENLDIKVIAKDMPETLSPKINNWVNKLKKDSGKIDEETYFIGHSIGCQTILRFLEKLPKNKKIGGAVFVAGWFNLKEGSLESKEEETIAKPWINTPIDFEKIKTHTKNFLAFFSDDDPFVPLTDIDLFKNNLDAKTILLKKKGHFDSVEEFREAHKKVMEFVLLK